MDFESSELSYGILGTGALGGFYGGLLARSGLPVHFLARSDYAALRSGGLHVQTPLGDFQLSSPLVYAQASEMPQVDVVVVAWKATANAALKSVLQSLCHSESIVLVLQNGWDVERSAAEVVGEDRILGGCCFLCSNRIGPGKIHHLDYGRIAFGEYGRAMTGKITSRMLRIADDFQKAGIDMAPAESLSQVRWKKLMWNIPFNGLSVVLQADTSEIMQNEDARQLATDLMSEVRNIALSCGTEISETHIAKILHDTRKMVPYASSMLVDFRERRPMEVEAIFGNPLRAALAKNLQPPKLEALYQQLKFLDTRNANG